MTHWLNVGAGKAANPVIEGYGEIVFTRLDGNPDANPDILHDIRDPFPEDMIEKYDGVVMSHILEHISWRIVLSTLNNVVQCVKPGGDFILVVPCLEWACEQVLKGVNDFSVMGIFYGGQKDELDYHKTGFTKVGAVSALQRCGLTVTSAEIGKYIAIVNDVRYEPKEIRVWAKKPERL